MLIHLDDIERGGLIWYLNEILYKALHLVLFDCEITVEYVPGTNQY